MFSLFMKKKSDLRLRIPEGCRNGIDTSVSGILQALNLATCLFKVLQDFLSLWEVSEEKLEGTGNKRGILMHGEVKQHSQKLLATFTIQVQIWVLLPDKCQQQLISEYRDYILF